ncbi:MULTISPECIES: efflux RND transporter periplasmic adaptor subunit [unclassified Maribacter]|uniref:efflux RND transporter periplasmic adaptor subunit n=3 Tax=Maribacter TaxID=252356 RepID=UPI00257C1BF0|nr:MULTISPECIES: efflux RND transporter periplasmic adaptor subunit [unclassified Maribacter]|tara:strand:- start:82065 stop:83765 length:1701 start_codon:yes stop_codon:yes gene_type:complete
MKSSNKYMKYVGYLAVLFFGLLMGFLLFDESDHVDGNSEKVSYTCSMHPDVIVNEEGKCPVCGMDLVKKVGEENSVNDYRIRMSNRALALADIQTSIVSFGEVSDQLTLSGEISLNRESSATQVTLFDGRIDELKINIIGQYVNKGQEIGTIYSPELYLAQDKLLTSASYKESHEKLFSAARNTLGLWKLTDKQIGKLLETGKPIKNFPLRADVSGTVVEIIATEGNYFKQGDPLFKVAELSTVWAEFQAYENQLSKLKEGQEIEISANALGVDPVVAKISFIEPIMDRNKRIVSVIAAIPNKEKIWKPGMFISGKVNIEIADKRLLILPKSAVLWTGEQSVVYKKIDGDKPEFEMLNISLGESVGGNYVVLNGLQEGDEIVTNGTFVIDAAAQLQGKRSMMYSSGTLSSSNGSSKDIPIELSQEQNLILKEALNIYFDLKNHFVKSNTDSCKVLSKELGNILVSLKKTDLEGGFKKNTSNAISSLELIAEGESLDKNRLEFKKLSMSFVYFSSYIKDYQNTIYIQHCPMADNNKGADWLSLNKAIKNPYFGDKMLHCGSVIKVVE